MVATKPARSFQSSELSRNPREVFAAADEHPIDVTRRDGDDLVLMSKREAESREQLLELAAQLIAVSTDDRGSLGDRMAHVFPWMLALTTEDRESCATQLLAAARASFATGQAHLAVAETISWRETATALAAGLGTTRVDWLEGNGVVVERP
ncbi:prevent-host-death protein [Rathayibacter sp. VKM Ac-2803]|uniref:prevent-host-death protein n=1 Tax=unclassified Rathayibacter TaxID=2609250 RepID=UPI00135A609E|nr:MULTISPECIES: prevent-host-death protein [unclassified Rathayibacter]MWV49443.1 prevent-host-death protein [Rathayibacter sp. VKM Ac-2803]MWV60579.1 prevent-host-death protein [Rathayibacter sp. VKM Ac-2754]